MDRQLWVDAEKQLHELLTEAIFLRENYMAKLSAVSRKKLGKWVVEYQLQVLQCQYKRGSTLGWCTTLHNLKRDQYLGKMENIRVELFRGKDKMKKWERL